MDFASAFDLQKPMFALGRLYTARLQLIGLESLGEQDLLLSKSRSSRTPVLAFARYPMRSLAAAAAFGLVILSAMLFYRPTTSDYWQATVVGTCSLYLAALAWALYIHDHRITLMRQRLLGELRTANMLRQEIDVVVRELECVVTGSKRLGDHSSNTM